MAEIEFSTHERDIIVEMIKDYFDNELDQEISGIDAGFLLDFFSGKIGPLYYNRGLYDAQAILCKRIDTIGEAILDLEQRPTQER